ncbi:MAG: TadE/TadG family type IV pilus assembly protein [Anaerolineae bacterium]|nr:pilus assembly protein [Caldilineales bacterium]MDW8267607.1 TadE/TadG family type IV pilus assembly protein [Anaerolineae bacterium]
MRQRWFLSGRRERGNALVELALTLPLLLMLTLGAIELGRGLNTYLALVNASREGARWWSTHPSDWNGALARVRTEAARAGVTNPTVERSPASGTPAVGTSVTVRVRHNHPLGFGAVTGVTVLPMRAETTMVVLYR